MTLRLSAMDELFRLAEQRLGRRSITQAAWVFDTDPGDDYVQTVCRSLSMTPLNRRAVRPTVPLARARWVHGEPQQPTTSHPSIGDDEIGAWLNDLVRQQGLRLHAGPSFAVDAVRTRSGQLVLSVCSLHAVADGKRAYAAFEGRLANDDAPDRHRAGGFARRFGGDVCDALQRAWVIAKHAGTSLRRRKIRRSAGGVEHARLAGEAGRARAVEPDPDSSSPQPALVTAQVGLEHWRQCAARHGGSSTALLIAVLIRVLEHGAHRDPLPGRRVWIVTSERTPCDTRANAIGGVEIVVPPDAVRAGALGTVRAISKKAYAGSADATGPGQEVLASLLGILPRPIFRRAFPLGRGAETVVSMLGAAPANTVRLCDVAPREFSSRVVTVGRSVSALDGAGEMLGAVTVQTDDLIAISFIGYDPAFTPDDRALRAMVAAELAEWGLEHRTW